MLFVYRALQTSESKLIRYFNNPRLLALSYVIVPAICATMILVPLDKQLITNAQLHDAYEATTSDESDRIGEKLRAHILIGWHVSERRHFLGRNSSKISAFGRRQFLVDFYGVDVDFSRLAFRLFDRNLDDCDIRSLASISPLALTVNISTVSLAESNANRRSHVLERITESRRHWSLLHLFNLASVRTVFERHSSLFGR